MQIQERFKEHAQRLLQVSSDADSGNEEVVRLYQSILHDFGFKTQLQEVRHSVEGLSKRQFNLVAFSSDSLVDRTTRKGILWVNPLDTVRLRKPHDPSVVVDDRAIVGPGAVQGKLDFLCRIYGALDLLDHRHKSPMYLVGTAASHSGMLGSRFLIESLAVHPKEVFTFAPTDLQVFRASPGHVNIQIDIDLPARNRDARGYNRGVEIIAEGRSADLGSTSDSENALQQLLDLLLAAAEAGFDFQWSGLESTGSEACSPDFAAAKIYLTAFQFEDFKQFLVSQTKERSGFSINYLGIGEGATQFLPTELIELILELDHEWRDFLAGLNSFPGEEFEIPDSRGSMSRLMARSTGRFQIGFDLRFLPNHQLAEIQSLWKDKIKQVLSKHHLFHGWVSFPIQVAGVSNDTHSEIKMSAYLSDAGLFSKAKFPTSIIGVGGAGNRVKTPSEFVEWKELFGAVETYREKMKILSQQ